MRFLRGKCTTFSSTYSNIIVIFMQCTLQCLLAKFRRFIVVRIQLSISTVPSCLLLAVMYGRAAWGPWAFDLRYSNNWDKFIILQFRKELPTRMRTWFKTVSWHQAITPLLEFLDQHLSSLNTWLLPRAFSRALAGCWSGVLKEVSSQADSGGVERPRVYHHRLREALDLLAEFFHAEGKGMKHSPILVNIYVNYNYYIDWCLNLFCIFLHLSFLIGTYGHHYSYIPTNK